MGLFLVVLVTSSTIYLALDPINACISHVLIVLQLLKL